MTSTQLDFLEQRMPCLMTPALKKAVKALQLGQPIMLLDASDRENEGDLVVAAEKITASSMNFLIQHGSGIVCLALPAARLEELALAPMVSCNTNNFDTAFTVSIEARQGITTGVSAHDRAITVKTAMNEQTKASDLAKPGHVFPLKARPQGLFERMGHTEGALDLVLIAGLKPGAVLCDAMSNDGSMIQGSKREEFAHANDIPVISLEEILYHRIKTQNILEHLRSQRETRFGKLVHHRFCFLGKDYIDIFMRPNNFCSSYFLKINTNKDYYDNYLNLVLDNNYNNNLLTDLKDLENNTNCDLVAILPQANNYFYALLCRALLTLEIKSLINNNQDFLILASNYFGIK